MSPRGIEFRGVRFGYRGERAVLTDLDLAVAPGVTLLVGPNGSGKSSLLKLAAGVERPDSGSVLVNGKDLWTREAEARRDLAYVPERPDVTPYASVGSVLQLVCRHRRVDGDRGREALETLGLANVTGSSIRELSKGQRHRVLLAAARVGAPHTLVLDEPLDGLDRVVRRSTLDWIETIRGGGGLVLVATRDLEPFVSSATTAIAMNGGRARLRSPLPEDPGGRLALLERLARGEA